ncbi:MAG: hypothetical protein ABIQ78_07365 [Dokdonella sp.]
MRIGMRLVALFFACAWMGGCSPQSPAPLAATTAAPSVEPQANKELALYRTLRQQQSWELAAPIGAEIVARFSGSAAATEVHETLADTTAKATAVATRRRLERLWSYQTGDESGGQQSTASIYSNDIAAGDRVRLILRRHSDWGQSVYLFGAGKGFVCRGTCKIAVRFDDKSPEQIKAYLPPTGEPALFISDDAGFIRKLGSVQKISIDVAEKGKSARTLVFDVGGFDSTRFAPVARKPSRARK